MWLCHIEHKDLRKDVSLKSSIRCNPIYRMTDVPYTYKKYINRQRRCSQHHMGLTQARPNYIVTSPSPQQKATMLFSSVCCLYLCKAGQFSIVQPSQLETKIHQSLFHSLEIMITSYLQVQKFTCWSFYFQLCCVLTDHNTYWVLAQKPYPKSITCLFAISKLEECVAVVRGTTSSIQSSLWPALSAYCTLMYCNLQVQCIDTVNTILLKLSLTHTHTHTHTHIQHTQHPYTHTHTKHTHKTHTHTHTHTHTSYTHVYVVLASV